VAKKKRKFKASLIDNVVGVFSPRAKVKRLKYKAISAGIKRKYEGADSGRRTEGWITHGNSSNAEIQAALPKLRNRSRDLIRNNPYAKNGVRLIANSTIGKGIMTQLKLDDSKEISVREQKLNEVYKAWSRTTACDFEGRKTLAAIQRLVMKSIVESGESIIRYRREGVRKQRYKGKTYTVPAFSLQVLESDFLRSDSLPIKLDNGNTIKQGIEFDSQGKILSYHLYQDHPGDIGLFSGARQKTIEVPAEEILHVYNEERAGQLRGIPWLHPVMLRLRDFDLFEDATLKRQQCAAMFVAFVHDNEGLDELEEEKEEIALGEKMEPGLIELLPTGKNVTLSKPPGAEGYEPYTSVVLHSIATGLGVTYSALTGNLKEVNFSSGRMGWLEMQRNIDAWRAELIIDQFMSPMTEKFIDEAELVGAPSQGARSVFTPPKREMIDPTKEVEALQTSVRSGFKTLSSAIKEAGEDPDTHFKELASDNEILDSLKLTLDSDARTVQTEGVE